MYVTLSRQPDTGEEHVVIVGRRAAEHLSTYGWPYNFVEIEDGVRAKDVLADAVIMDRLRN